MRRPNVLIHDLCVHYPQRNGPDFIALNGVSLGIFKGETFGLLGANGAGKSTLISVLCGLVTPSNGRAFICDLEVGKQQHKIKPIVGYMSQQFSLYKELSWQQNIHVFGGLYGLSYRKIKQKLEEVEKDLELYRFQHGIVAELPLGVKQHLAFFIAMMHSPRLLILDEPTAGVDPWTRRLFWQRIDQARQTGVSILVTTHYPEEAEYCDRVCLLEQGVVQAIGYPEKLKSDAGVSSIAALFGKQRNQDKMLDV